MKIKQTLDIRIFNILAYSVVGFFAIITVIPFIILLVSSFTSEHYIINHGYTMIPKEFSFDAYKLVFKQPMNILRAYGITVSITLIGTSLSLFFSSMAAYVLYRKEVKYRSKLAFFLYFTTLFHGGLASFYIIITNFLHLKDSYFVLLLIPMFNVVFILILRSFMQSSLHESLLESAKIDGAGDFEMFIKIVLPLSKPALATVGLFVGLAYWNDWWSAMLFIDNPQLYPLQYVLYRALSSAESAIALVNAPIVLESPKETLKLALTVISTGPIVLAYPFAQKYFVKGIMIGSVKG